MNKIMDYFWRQSKPSNSTLENRNNPSREFDVNLIKISITIADVGCHSILFVAFLLYLSCIDISRREVVEKIFEFQNLFLCNLAYFHCESRLCWLCKWSRIPFFLVEYGPEYISQLAFCSRWVFSSRCKYCFIPSLLTFTRELYP